MKTIRPGIIGLALALVAGAGLRLSWGHDIEYKGDERFNFNLSQTAGRSESLPKLGMNSGVSLPNPGLSVWVFVALARLSWATTPVDLARTIQLLNVTALLLLTLFVIRCVPADSRETWLWGIALACVNPIDVLLQRKIWAPSVFPILTTTMLACWWNSASAWPAFAWGLIGASLGQIQMAAFAFAASFASCTFVFARRSVNWWAWTLGSAVGVLPMLPWVENLVDHVEELRRTPNLSRVYADFSLVHHPLTGWIDTSIFQFPLVWIVNTLGVGLDYSLFDEVWMFLKYPYFGTHPSFIGLIATVLILVVFTWAISSAFKRSVTETMRKNAWRSLIVRHSSFGLAIAFLGFGVLVTLAPYFVQRHYLLVTFPYEFVGLAALVRFAFPPSRSRYVLTTLALCQFTLTATFLWYIHVNRGASRGDFGVTYGAQSAAENHD